MEIVGAWYHSWWPAAGTAVAGGGAAAGKPVACTAGNAAPAAVRSVPPAASTQMWQTLVKVSNMYQYFTC